jgi:EmrB/QacA subfamily drug resistance transporter
VHSEARTRNRVLAVTTIGNLAATLNGSILLIALPAIFEGLGMDPLAPANISYLLWLLMGFGVVAAVLVVTFGRLGDQFGRAKIFNLGFAIFTAGAVGCSLNPLNGDSGALVIIAMRVVQGIGGAMIMANSGALITDAFPPEKRGFALGVNQVAALVGSFLGLVLGGALVTWDWRAVFWVNVPIGVWGTWTGYRVLKDDPNRERKRISIDWWGNVTFAVGLVALLIGITYGLQPYGNHDMGWTSPTVLAEMIGGVLLLVVFCLIELRVADPMIDMRLFKNRAFSAGQTVNLLASMTRGGLQFMLIIWLQGIWLPLHGYAYADTPLWAGISMVPLTIGFVIAGPISGVLSDRFGARTFATGGLLLTAATFGALLIIPINFNYMVFASILLLYGIGMGAMSAPNAAAVMNSVPASARGAASGIRATGLNAGQVLSMGLFFTMMAVGLSSTLPSAMNNGLVGAGVDPAAAAATSHTSPVGMLFAAFLGYNPIKALVPHPGPNADANLIYGQHFFPHLISKPFEHGLVVTFTVAIILLLIAAGASLMRGKTPVYEEAMTTPRHASGLHALEAEAEALTGTLDADHAADYESASR